jgi:hypothetical protein
MGPYAAQIKEIIIADVTMNVIAEQANLPRTIRVNGTGAQTQSISATPP